MRLSDLKPAKGAKFKSKRRGRGTGSGHGKTSCRGHKGQKARSGTKRRHGFEGGQMPLIRRIPKRGFTSKSKISYQLVNLKDLAKFKAESPVTPKELKAAGLIKDLKNPVKILGTGAIETALTISAHKFSNSAKEKLIKAGGKPELIKC